MFLQIKWFVNLCKRTFIDYWFDKIYIFIINFVVNIWIIDIETLIISIYSNIWFKSITAYNIWWRFYCNLSIHLLYIAFNFFINIYYKFNYIRVFLEHYIYILDNFLKKISLINIIFSFLLILKILILIDLIL